MHLCKILGVGKLKTECKNEISEIFAPVKVHETHHGPYSAPRPIKRSLGSASKQKKDQERTRTGFTTRGLVHGLSSDL